MTTATKIKNAIKEAGYNNRQVTVANRNYIAFVLTIRSEEVNPQDIKEIARRFESISRCDVTGEILSGGNTYIRVVKNIG